MDDINKQKQETLSIPRKALLGIAPAIGIIGMLLSKRNIGPLFLFLIGITLGVFIGKGFFEKK